MKLMSAIVTSPSSLASLTPELNRRLNRVVQNESYGRALNLGNDRRPTGPAVHSASAPAADYGRGLSAARESRKTDACSVLSAPCLR